MPPSVRIKIDDILVRRAGVTASEPGSHAEWKLEVRLGSFYTFVFDDWVRDGKVLPVAIQSGVIDLATQPGLRLQVRGVEDDLGGNERLPSVDVLANSITGTHFVLESGPHVDFEYAVRGRVEDLDRAPWHVTSETGGVSNSNVGPDVVESFVSGLANTAAYWPNGRIVVGTENGGAWSVGTESAECLSDDWPDARVLTMCQPSRSPELVLVGTRQGHLWLLFANGVRLQLAAAMPGCGQIRQIIEGSFKGEPIFLAATERGVYWTSNLATLGAWKRVLEPAGSPPVFSAPAMIDAFSVAALGGDAADFVAVIGKAQPETVGPRKGQVICSAKFSASGDLVLERSSVVAKSFPGRAIRNVSVASSGPTWKTLFALGFDNEAGRTDGLFRTDDLGATWATCPMATVPGGGDDPTPFVEAIGTRGNGGLFRHISVRPGSDGEVVAAVGLKTVISLDGGSTARVLRSLHLHDDAHHVHFSTVDPNLAIVATDGGITVLSGIELAVGAQLSGGLASPLSQVLQFDSGGNRSLPTFMVSGLTMEDSFPGRFDVSSTDSFGGLSTMAIGLQDNHTAIRRWWDAGPWRIRGGGDGTFNAVLPEAGVVLHTGQGLDFQADRFELGEPRWTETPQVFGTGKGLGGSERVDYLAMRLATPRHPSPSTKVFAIASCRVSPAGMGTPQCPSPLLFTLRRNIDDELEWQGHDSPFPSGEVVTAIDIDAAGRAVMGSNAGRILFWDAVAAASIGGPVTLTPSSSKKANSHPIRSIATTDGQSTYAVDNKGGLWIIDGASMSAQTMVLPPTPTDQMRSVVAVPGSMAATVLVSGQTDVFLTDDDGANWSAARRGLPAGVLLQDLSTARMDGDDYVFVSTWGRSLWQANLQHLISVARA